MPKRQSISQRIRRLKTWEETELELKAWNKRNRIEHSRLLGELNTAIKAGDINRINTINRSLHEIHNKLFLSIENIIGILCKEEE